MSNYTISKMFRASTPWNVYSPSEARQLIKYAEDHAECDENYSSLYTALLAQHQILAGGEIALPLKVIERFDIERKRLKKKGEPSTEEYNAVRSLALGGAVRVTNGTEILQVRLAALGLSNPNG